MDSPLKMPILAEQTIGVLGSGVEEHAELAYPVGRLLAELGVNLLTGGGRGVMRAVSRAFTQARRPRGVCIGILPCLSERERGKPPPGYPNEFVELAIHTHLPYSGERGKHDLSRNHINVLSCAALIALPGALGTASEVSLAIDYEKPIVAYCPDRLVRYFPRGIERVTAIDDVRRFLRQYIRRVA